MNYENTLPTRATTEYSHYKQSRHIKDGECVTEINLENIFAEENSQKAMESFEGKRDSCGADGVMVSDLAEYWDANQIVIKDAIYSGNYSPGIVKQREIVSKIGKHRIISQMNTVDRFLLRAVAQVLSERVDSEFSEHSYAYRENKGTLAAAEHAASCMQKGKIWSAELDIQHFFDCIPHDRLIEKLRRYVKDERVMNLIISFLHCTIEDDYRISQKTLGIVQGSPLSPVLSNLYLNDIDQYMEEKGYSFCRFGDNINTYTASYEEAWQQLQELKNYLQEREGLLINEGRTGVFKGMNRRLLGFVFEEKDGKVIVKRAKNAEKTVFRGWYTTGIQKVDRNYHLINDGILTRQDYNILFENKERKKYIPVETMDSLYIYSNTIFTSEFFSFINKKGLNIAFFDKFGEKIGSFVPQNSRKNMKTEIKQMQIYQDEKERLAIARKLEIASVANLRANLRYYGRRKESEVLTQAVEQITAYIKKLNEAQDVNGLMLIEAQARQKYYQCFNEILDSEEFIFTKRTRRPPKDPLNSMISFGNTMLYQRIANEINRTSLDIRIGFVHAAGFRAESLNLDIADIFKPILVDRTIFTLINRKMMHATDFVEVENEGIFISGEGKRLFIREFERKLYQTILIDGQQRTYDYVIKREIQKIKKYVEQGEKYVPYKYI